MRVLHVGMLSPHVHQVQRMLAKFGPPGLRQEHVLPGERPIGAFDLVLVHGVNFWFEEVARFDQVAPVVGLLWNDRWVDAPEAEEVIKALDRCSLVIAPHESVVHGEERWRTEPRRTLIDGDVFKPDPEKAIEFAFLSARNCNRDRANLYWTREIRAIGLPELRQVPGDLGPEEMADWMQRARVVIACCAVEWGPSNTAIEAALCGKIPVLSDVPQIRQYFEEHGMTVGARFCNQHPASINAACVQVLEMDPEQHRIEVERNLEVFRDWTIQAQGPRLTRAILSCTPAGRLVVPGVYA